MGAVVKDNALFLSVIEAHKGILYKIASAYCADAEDRKDLIQEIIVQLWRCFEKYDNRYKYSTWIYRIALNVAISFYRKESRRAIISNPVSQEIVYLPDWAYDNETDVKLNQLQKFIAELRELDKAVLLLYLEEKSHKEIALIMNISETNVATKIGRIKTSLKEKFSKIKNQ